MSLLSKIRIALFIILLASIGQATYFKMSLKLTRRKTLVSQISRVPQSADQPSTQQLPKVKFKKPQRKISDEQVEQIADNLYELFNNVSQVYYESDMIMLLMHVTNELTNIGTHSLTEGDGKKEISIILNTFAKLMGKEIPKMAQDILSQIHHIEFIKNKSNQRVKFFGNEGKDIVIPINKVVDDGGKVEMIKNIVIKHKASFKFKTVETQRQREQMFRDITKKKLDNELTKVDMKAVGQINIGILKNLKSYIEITGPILPLRVSIKGVYVVVKAGFINNLKIKLEKLYTLPGIKDGDEFLPNFVGIGNALSFVKIRFSVDSKDEN